MFTMSLLRKGGVGVQDRMSIMSGEVFGLAIKRLPIQVYDKVARCIRSNNSDFRDSLIQAQSSVAA